MYRKAKLLPLVVMSSLLVLLLFVISSCQEKKTLWKDEWDLIRKRVKPEAGIRMIAPNSYGTTVDAKILADIFKTDFTVFNQNENASDLAFANVFIERIRWPIQRYAKYNILLVNQEFIAAPKLLEKLDLVICKSHYASRLLKEMRQKYNLSYKILTTAFTSISLTENVLDNPKQFDMRENFSLALHLAGKSPYKSTPMVVNTWLANPDFPKLLATCIDMCTVSGFHEQLPKNSRNVLLMNQFLPHKVVNDYLSKAAFFVAPSTIEGYGHYINEGRMQGGVVITTDAPPMNELITDGQTGFLVPIKHSWIMNPYSKAKIVLPDAKELEKKMREILEMPKSKLMEIGMKARKAYEDDRKELIEKISTLSKHIFQSKPLSVLGGLE